jgi:hypothetical protein
VKAIAAGENFSLFLKNDGTVWVCGINSYGQTGTGDYIDYNYPVQLTSLSNVVAIAAGYNESVFLKSDGSVWACGFNNSGQLGTGDTLIKPSPVLVPGLCSVATDIDETGLMDGSVKVFPVPASSMLHLQVEKSGHYRLELRDIQGGLVMQRDEFIENDGVYTLSVDNLQNGIYFLSLADGLNNKLVRRVLIN